MFEPSKLFDVGAMLPLGFCLAVRLSSKSRAWKIQKFDVFEKDNLRLDPNFVV
jgi:hypothetical protein